MITMELKEVLLSTGEFTPEVRIFDDGRLIAFESSPKGSTTGAGEAPEQTMEDGDAEQLMHVNLCLNSSIAEYDQKISGLGSKLSTPLSLACLRLKAHSVRRPLPDFVAAYYGMNPKIPRIITNVLNGGKHAGNGLSFCEFMLIPAGESIQEQVRVAQEVYSDLHDLIVERYGKSHVHVGREGGFAPAISDEEEALSLLNDAIDRRHHGACSIALDIAADNFGTSRGSSFTYHISGRAFSSVELYAYYGELLDRFPLAYLEDPFHEEDAQGWELAQHLLDRVLVVADDLTVTQEDRLRAHAGKYNAVILKPNQNGTVSGFVEAFRAAQNFGAKTIVSQRSGENDTHTIVDLGVGLGADYLKLGAPARERIVKYNHLLRSSIQ